MMERGETRSVCVETTVETTVETVHETVHETQPVLVAEPENLPAKQVFCVKATVSVRACLWRYRLHAGYFMMGIRWV